MAYETLTIKDANGVDKTIVVDDIGSDKIQVVKLDIGADGASVPVIAGQQARAASLPVALSSEDAAYLDSLEALLAATNAALAGTLAISAASLPLPTGAATSANQDTANTALAAIQTAVQTLDNAISGTEMRVDVVTALPAGDNNIGNVDLASAIPAGTNNIGDVDVLTVPADPFGVNADAASATGSISAKLRASAVALEVIDDWDESDRAKVNLIASQAGITGGAGNVAANTPRVTLAADDPAVVHLAALAGATEFETVAASQTDQMLGSTGAVGDLLAGLLIIPATTSPGAVSIEYGSTNITVFAGGASSVSNLVPFWVPLGIKTPSDGGWEITTGTNVSVIAVGNFT